MMDQRKVAKTTVELGPARPSRIRREPARSVEAERMVQNAWWTSREWEIRLALAGIAFFAVAMCAVVLDVGTVLSW